MDEVQARLEHVLVAHQLEASFEKGAFTMAEGLRLTPFLHDTSTGPNHHSVLLELLAESPVTDGRTIVEGFASAGDNREQALADAFQKMLLGTFHVLLEGLTDHRCDEPQAEIERWKSSSGAWNVYGGPLISCHSGTQTLSPTYADFLPELQALFERTQRGGVHWLRVFAASYNGRMMAEEVLLDNEPWDAGLELLRKQAWTPSDSYESIRQFLIARPVDGHGPQEGTASR